MRKILLFLACVCAASAVSCKKDKVDIWVDNSPVIEFKDPLFEIALMELSEMSGEYIQPDNGKRYATVKDLNGDGKISEQEASRVEYLDLRGYKIRNVDELSYFTSLKVLYCQSNRLTGLDLSKNTLLTEINCMDNQLTSLAIGKNTSLKSLNCRYNQITTLDVTGCSSLTELICESNSLRTLVLGGCSSLLTLNCSNNSLNSLDVTGCPELETINCSENQLTCLDVSKNKYLSTLICSGNPLERLLIYIYYCLPETFVTEHSDIIEKVG